MAKKAARTTTTKKAAPRKGARPASAKSDFAAKKKAAKAGWREHRGKNTGPTGYDNLELMTGNHYARLTSASLAHYKGGPKKGVRYGKFQYAVLFGDCAGEGFTINIDMDAEKFDMERVLFTRKNGEQVTSYDILDETLINHGIDTSELDWDEIPEALKAINEDKPFVEVYVQNKRQTGAGKSKSYESCDEYGPRADGYVQNIRVNSYLSREEAEVIAAEHGEELPAA